MIDGNILSRRRKRNRLKINSLNDFKDALNKEGYLIDNVDEKIFNKRIQEIFEVDKKVIEKIYEDIEIENINYKVNDAKEFIDYIEKNLIFEDEHKKLCEKIKKVNIMQIDRIEYEREPSTQDNVESIIKNINKISRNITSIMDKQDKKKLKRIEDEIDKEYLYAKDIELLKKIISPNKKYLSDDYDEDTKTKTVILEIPSKITKEYINGEKGSVEYYKYLNSNIPRIRRLNRNLDKYIKVKEEKQIQINQSEAIQDSINIAVGVYNGNEFRAISGKNDISNCCKSPSPEKTVFKSSKVNKRGNLGIGYNRVNDSEKKILEEIHKLIENKTLDDCGELVLYSKWEPCPSCYYVIYQFCEKHPNINFKVKYIRKYGE